MFSLDALFCHVDDFCQALEAQWQKKLLNHGGIQRNRSKSLCLSEIVTILIAFHQNHYRNFKYFYLNQVKQYWSDTNSDCRYINPLGIDFSSPPSLFSKIASLFFTLHQHWLWQIKSFFPSIILK
jgi:hypothetical protein